MADMIWHDKLWLFVRGVPALLVSTACIGASISMSSGALVAFNQVKNEKRVAE